MVAEGNCQTLRNGRIVFLPWDIPQPSSKRCFSGELLDYGYRLEGGDSTVEPRPVRCHLAGVRWAVVQVREAGNA